MRILVTGGAGFIGSHLADRLIESGHKVYIIDDLSGGRLENVNPKAVFYKLDLRKARPTEYLIAKIRPELVYHLAANAAENNAQFSPIDVTSRGYNAFMNTLVASLRHGMKRIVVTSSIAVYGALQTPFKETDEPKPEDLYGIGKLAMEESLKVLSRVHKFEYVITRPHNVYGPRQNMRDPYRNVVTIFMNSLLQNKPYYIYGDGKMRRCFTYVSDVVDALFKCGFRNVQGTTFNIGADRDYTVNQLSKVIQKVTGGVIRPVYIKSRPQEVKIAISDHSLAKKYLNYKDQISLPDGIQITWKYAKMMGYQKPKYKKVELDSPLMPEIWRFK